MNHSSPINHINLNTGHNQGHYFVHRAQTAPADLSQPQTLAPPVPPRPRVPHSLVPGLSQPRILAHFDDLSFRTPPRKEWSIPEVGPTALSHDVASGTERPTLSPPLIPPYPVTSTFSNPPPPPPLLPPKPAKTAELAQVVATSLTPVPPLSNSSFLELSSPSSISRSEFTAISSEEKSLQSQSPIETSSNQSLLHVATKNVARPVDDPVDHDEDVPLAKSPIDNDLAEAMRLSLLLDAPGGEVDENMMLAMAISSLDNEDALRAAERERLDLEFARRLQQEEEQAVAPATLPRQPQPPMDTKKEVEFDGSARAHGDANYDLLQPDPPPYPPSDLHLVHAETSKWPGAYPSSTEHAAVQPLRRGPSADGLVVHSNIPSIRERASSASASEGGNTQNVFSRSLTDPMVPSSSSQGYSMRAELQETLQRPASVAVGDAGSSPSGHSAYNSNSSAMIRPPRVEAELLMGVSFGFTPPPFTNDLSPMAGVIPDVINLPPAPSPPFHLQARSWRSLLRLLAKMDSTRLVPSIEAVAVSKEEVRLRTVVQVNRVAHSSWRIVIYLTLDHPLPPSSRGLYRYTNGDTTSTPYSYILCNPALEFHNNEVTQFYTIPATATSPHPSLPISLPNLALYLQSALEDSRKSLNDSSGGFRRLARMVETSYPEEMRAVEDDEGWEGGGRNLKRLFAGWRKPKERGRGGNEEVYDLVTPFRIDEWG